MIKVKTNIRNKHSIDLNNGKSWYVESLSDLPDKSDYIVIESHCYKFINRLVFYDTDGMKPVEVHLNCIFSHKL